MNVIKEGHISNVLFQACRTEKTFNLVVQELGAYSKAGKVHYHIAFQGRMATTIASMNLQIFITSGPTRNSSMNELLIVFIRR